MESEIRVTTSFKIKPSIRDRFKIICIQNKIEISELLEKIMEREIIKHEKQVKQKGECSLDDIQTMQSFLGMLKANADRDFEDRVKVSEHQFKVDIEDN